MKLIQLFAMEKWMKYIIGKWLSNPLMRRLFGLSDFKLNRILPAKSSVRF